MSLSANSGSCLPACTLLHMPCLLQWSDQLPRLDSVNRFCQASSCVSALRAASIGMVLFNKVALSSYGFHHPTVLLLFQFAMCAGLTCRRTGMRVLFATTAQSQPREQCSGYLHLAGLPCVTSRDYLIHAQLHLTPGALLCCIRSCR